MRNKLVILLKIIVGSYIILCGVLYAFQERLIFFPQKLEKDYSFHFNQNFQELNFEVRDGKTLNGLLFKADRTKGLIFYLHGNAGSLNVWGSVAKTYTELNYDVFILDYRSFGKSEGVIKNQEQLFEDNQFVYQKLKKIYGEENMIILGYSIGTGMAANLASKNSPSQLILQAPYYSLTDMMRHRFPIIPTFILKYTFATHEYLKNCKMPITIFHGNLYSVIYYESSLKLKKDFPKINLITLDKHGHNGMTNNERYRTKLKSILEK